MIEHASKRLRESQDKLDKRRDLRDKAIIDAIKVGITMYAIANAQEPNAPSASPKVEAAPLIMSEEQATVEESAEPILESSETDFITFMQPYFSGWHGELPPDEELLAAGYLACEKRDDGVPEMEIEVIPGSLETPRSPLYENNQQIATSAISALCKQHLPN